LAGISSDYYLRLEQGRDKHPSAEVINALAGALKLDVKATEYLHQLTAPRAARTLLGNSETVADGAEELIDQFPMPVIIASRYLDVLAANPLARVLSRSFAPGGNLLRWQLEDPAVVNSSIGTRRPTYWSAAYARPLEATPTIHSCVR